MTDQEIRELLVLTAFRRGGYKRLAHQIGISQSYLSSMVHGRYRPNRKVLQYLGLGTESKNVSA